MQDKLVKLRHELDRWADQGLTARLWTRDDDAHALTEPLARLHALARDYKIRVGLAVIPGLLDSELPDFLNEANACFFPMCHGWMHVNHSPEGRPSEFGNDRPHDRLLNDLELAYHRFHESFGHLKVVFVPPFAGIAPSVIEALPNVGFSGLSIGPSFFEHHLSRLAAKIPFPSIRLKTGSAFPQINAQIDLIDWRLMTAWDAATIAERITGHLRLRRCGTLDSNFPLGLLTHHLHHDEKIWALYEALLELLCRHQAVKFFDLSDEFEILGRDRASAPMAI